MNGRPADRHLPDISGEQVFRLLEADPRTRPIPVGVLSADAVVGGVRRLLELIDETLADERRP